MSYSIELSPEIYKFLQQRATMLNASLASVVESAVRLQQRSIDTVRTDERLPAGLSDELDQLAFLTDAELWNAARTRLHEDEQTRMEFLLDRQQASGLSTAEAVEAEMLAEQYDRTMLVRAKAAVLLKERGHDISSLGPDAQMS